ncbi:MAG: GH25 family lysozyme [Akkermansiaceae bacterium]
MLRPLLFLALSLVTSCAGTFGKVTYEESPKVINVSSYDPKERSRSGSSYSPLNQAALRANGAQGMIARIGKGMVIDTKCADFLVGAEKQSMKLGVYYFVRANSNITAQADQLVSRLRSIKKSRGLKTEKVLLVGDIDTLCTAGQIITFLDRVEALTGVTPVVYLENSKGLIARLSSAPKSQRKQINRAPYWLALYSDTNKEQPHIQTPEDLTKAYKIWDTWAMWQYGGVFWENRKSTPKHYRRGKWTTPAYFGNLDRVTERNGFNGSQKDFEKFWDKHSWKW